MEMADGRNGANATLDDAAAEISYTGFESTKAGLNDIPAIKTGSFYSDTVSYTSSAGASASFSFTGQSQTSLMIS